MNADPLAIQIVAFDWPWPPTYGGIIDVYYRVDALLERGVHVDLHVVSQRAAPAPPPAHWLASGRLRLFEFPRRGWRAALSFQPYIVTSRAVAPLLPQLASGAPVILFEGVHTTAWLGHPRLAGKEQWVRVHNREADYYTELVGRGHGWRQNLYYREEARRLRRYEGTVLAEADLLLPISPQDDAWCTRIAPGRVLGQRGYSSTRSVTSAPGRGDYALFHGAFHVADNVTSALLLAERMQRRPNIRLVLAGRTPPGRLRAAVAGMPNVEVVADPDAPTMARLIREAQVLTLHTGHQAGYKIKLVESLAHGRWVLVNERMVVGAPGLRAGVRVADGERGWLDALDALWQRPFGTSDVPERSELLRGYLRDDLVAAFIRKLETATFRGN